MRDGNTFRLFIAISPPETVKDEIEKAQAELRRALPGNLIRWTRRDQFHLTLKFLGDVGPERVAPLVDIMTEVCAGFPAIQLRAARIGFFLNEKFPRVIWAGVHDDGALLPKLQLAMESAVKEFTVEKAAEHFAGHLTLGRIKAANRKQAEILRAMASRMADARFGEWIADKIELIRSELSSDGSRYETLAGISLKAQ